MKLLNARFLLACTVTMLLTVLTLAPYEAKAQGQRVAAQPREMIPLSTWQFAEDTTATTPTGTMPAPPVQANWTTVRVPHIFRQSGLPDDAAGWYRQDFTLSPADRTRRIFLRLDGAAVVKDVFVNGQHIGQHKGAFTAAAFDLTAACKIGQPNHLAVRISNRAEETHDILARSSLFYVNGGMFRQAWLIKTGAVHIFPDMGSSGVYVTPANVSAGKADIGIRTVVRNPLAAPATVTVRHIVTDPSGKVCARFETKATVAAGETSTLTAMGTIAQPKLWDLGQPNLYTVRTELSAGNALSDVVTEHTGFRTIEFKNNHFLLNGREVQFRGVNKHAQNEYEWNATSDGELQHEWQTMANMGVNAVRLAHYPHSHLEYDIADARGIAVWAENGFAGQQWVKTGNEDKAVTPDGERLTREMVRQNWNHPAIFFWSCGNETIVDTANHYAGIIRQEDTSRLVTYASAGGNPTNCDFVANNTYDGWYGGQYTGFDAKPRNAIVSETGSGEWITHHVPYGTMQWSVDNYEPAEYSELFTEYRLQTIFRNDVANRPMFLWWNFREFYDHKFKQNRNTKGILTLAGMPKDIYFLFQSFMRPDVPVVHLNGRHFFLRQFAPDNGIKAFSNAATLELMVNGQSQGTHANGDYHLPASSQGRGATATTVPGIAIANVFFWKAPLQLGRNVIEVRDGKGQTDRMVIYQKTPGEALPADPTSLLQDVHSSNPDNPAVFIDRPVESQGPVYSDVDGSSDNTFDVLPPQVEGAGWITTRRLSDSKQKTDLSFRINPASKGGTIFVLFSNGTYPAITLKKPNAGITAADIAFSQSLKAAGFADTGVQAVWRDQDLNRTGAALWSHAAKPGETLTIPGATLDYVVLVKNAGG